VSRPAGRLLELSVGQQALWLLYRIAPESPAYNVLIGVRLRGPLDLPALAGAVAAVEQRHELVGCRFDEAGGVAGWRPGPAGSVRLEVRDAAGDDLSALAGRAYREPFRLTEQAPLRVVLLRRSARDAVLLVVAHHLVTDATSQWLLLRDLLAAYQGLCRGGSPQWQPLRQSYREYVAAERELLGSAYGARLAEYWRGACAGAVAGTLGDKPHRAGTAGRGASQQHHLPEALVAGVRNRAAQQRSTPFALLLGAFGALLHRYGGQPDFLVGCPGTVRLRPGLRDVVGHFVNTLPVRATFDPQTTLHDAVSAASSRLAAGLAHIRYPCALLSAAGAGTGGGPLFHTALTMLAPPRLDPPLPMPAAAGGEGAAVELAGLRISLLDLAQQEAQLDLLVEVVPAGAAMRLSLRYDTDRVDGATVTRLAGHFQAMVEAAVADPGRRVSSIPLIDDSEAASLLALGAGAPTA
jgi:Condensation domain